MAKELGIVRGHHHRSPSESCASFSKLVLALRQEMGRMLLNRLQGLGAIVDLFVSATAGDSMVLESAGVANPGTGEKPRHGFPLRLIGQISVEFPVSRVSWVSALTAPDLSGAERVAPENRDSSRAAHWKKDRSGCRR
jgi:hypothetical protein